MLCLAVNSSSQHLQLPRIFADNMVLQHDTEVRIWGRATMGDTITIKLGNISRTTLADEKGYWETYLPAYEAGGPHTVTVKDITHTESKQLKNIYFGDVWLADGQSNMEWKLNWGVDNWKDEVQKSTNFPEIRFFEIPQKIGLSQQDTLPGGSWTTANPKTAGNFSAVAWYFAKRNHLDKGVPVGIIESNWGGTPAEAWTPAQALLEVTGYRKAAGEILNDNIDWHKRFEENREKSKQKERLINDPTAGLKKGVHVGSFDDSNWETVKIPTEENLTDVVWLRRTFTISQSDIDSVKFSSGEIMQEALFYLNGKNIGVKTWQNKEAVFTIEPSLLNSGSNTLAVRIVNSWDNQVVIGGDQNMNLLVNNDKKQLTGEWRYSNDVVPPIPEVERYEWKPGFLYNAMIHPITGFTIKGIIWYQGESNVGKHKYYNELFETLISEWRHRWNQGNFPFLFVQLANYLERHEKHMESDWACLREAQTQTLSLANTGMATTIDIGEADDIHPGNKHDVGKRLWLAAKKVAYGDNIIPKNPI